MENFEIIDQYLTGKLDAAQRLDFENQLAGNPVLQKEVADQKQIIEGVKLARQKELKAMLSKVPVPPVSGSSTFALKWVAGILATGAVVTFVYFSAFRSETKTVPSPALDELTKNLPSQDIKATEDTTTENEPIVIPKDDKKAPHLSASELRSDKKDNANSNVTPAQKPVLELVDPSDEISTEQEAETTNGQATIQTAQIEVETDSSQKKYSFHYQFADSKLILYGPFDKNLYEILEVNGENHAIFLYQKENYYLLNEKETRITPLKAITDPSLIRLLREYRR
jgi:uncharacterized protein (UPF0333 family)